MSGFWPAGIDLMDTASPLEILITAQNEWEKSSGGKLTLAFQEAHTESGHAMIIVHAKFIPGNRTATFFSVVHRLKAPYPVLIQPDEENLPDFLKKNYRTVGIGEIGTRAFYGREIENKWVSDTPKEFRSKLKDVLNLGSVKSVVLSLLAHSPTAGDLTVGREGDGPPSQNGKLKDETSGQGSD